MEKECWLNFIIDALKNFMKWDLHLGSKNSPLRPAPWGLSDFAGVPLSLDGRVAVQLSNRTGADDSCLAKTSWRPLDKHDNPPHSYSQAWR